MDRCRDGRAPRRLHPLAIVALVVWALMFVPLLLMLALFRFGVFGI
jgi:hypothetical protein